MLGALHVIIDVRPGVEPVALIEAVLEGGARVVQIRDKTSTDRDRYQLAVAAVARCHSTGALCIIDDRVDIALAAGADGVHVGEHDLPVAIARRLMGSDAIIGATARDSVTARAQQIAGATYLGVGPAYETTTKSGLPAPLGPAAVGKVTASVDIPVVAIGGVDADRVRELMAVGCHGVAVVGAVAAASDPAAATRALCDALPVVR